MKLKVNRQTQIIYLELYIDPFGFLSGRDKEQTYIPIHKSVDQLFGKGSHCEFPEHKVQVDLAEGELLFSPSVRGIGYLNSDGILVEAAEGDVAY